MDNFEIILNVNNYGVTPIVHVVQGDTGRTLICTIADMTIPSGATAKFFAQKPSGAGIYNNAIISGNTVTVELTNQTLAEVGTTKAQLQIINSSGDTVSTFDFIIDVQKTLSGDFPESETESTYLQGVLDDMQDQVNTAVQQAGTATTAANNAASGANSAASSANSAAQAANSAAQAAEAVVDDIGNTPITFTQATTRTNLATGDTVKTAFGKIMKWFADLGAAAFQAVADNLTTIAAGSVLDARQGKILSDNITAAQNALQTQIGALEDLDTTAKSNVVGAVNELNSNMPEIPAAIRFVSKMYTASSFNSVNDMLKDCAESMPSDQSMYIIRIVYGSIYSAIVTTYANGDYRSIFAMSYALNQPIYLQKYNGVWNS